MSIWRKLSMFSVPSLRRVSFGSRSHMETGLECCYPLPHKGHSDTIHNIEELIENGMFNYEYLESLFAGQTSNKNYLGSVIFKKLNCKTSRISPTKLIRYARMAPATSEGYQVITNLMEEYAKFRTIIGDYDSCIKMLDCTIDKYTNSVSLIHYHHVLTSLKQQLFQKNITRKEMKQIGNNVLFLWNELISDNYVPLIDNDNSEIIKCALECLEYCLHFNCIDRKLLSDITNDLYSNYFPHLTIATSQDLLLTVLPYFGKFCPIEDSYNNNDNKDSNNIDENIHESRTTVDGNVGNDSGDIIIENGSDVSQMVSIRVSKLLDRHRANLKQARMFSSRHDEKLLLAMIECNLHLILNCNKTDKTVLSSLKRYIFQYLAKHKWRKMNKSKRLSLTKDSINNLCFKMCDITEKIAHLGHFDVVDLSKLGDNGNNGDNDNTKIMKYSCDYAIDFLNYYAIGSKINKFLLQYFVLFGLRPDSQDDWKQWKQYLTTEDFDPMTWFQVVDTICKYDYNTLNDDGINNREIGNMTSLFLKQHSNMIKNMQFNDIVLSLKGLNTIHRHCLKNIRYFEIRKELTSQVINNMRKTESRLIDLFLSNQLFYTKNHSFIINWNSGKYTDLGVSNSLHNINYIMTILAHYRLYNWKAIRLLAQQCCLIMYSLKPSTQYTDNTIEQLSFSHLTKLLLNMRYLSFHHHILYVMIGKKLQQRPHLISLSQLRDWCLAFATMSHIDNGIWLTIQSCLMNYQDYIKESFNNSNYDQHGHFLGNGDNNNSIISNIDSLMNVNNVNNVNYNGYSGNDGMPVDMLIDFVWSMMIVDLMPPESLLMNEMIEKLYETVIESCLTPNGTINETRLNEKLAIEYQIRFFEILLSMEAGYFNIYQTIQSIKDENLKHKWGMLIESSVIKHFEDIYHRYVIEPFNFQCKQRLMLNFVIKKYINDKYKDRMGHDISVDIGTVVNMNDNTNYNLDTIGLNLDATRNVLTDLVIRHNGVKSNGQFLPNIVIEVGDFPCVTHNEKNQISAWIKFPGRRQLTKRILKKNNKEWFVIDLGNVNTIDSNANAWIVDNLERFTNVDTNVQFPSKNTKTSLFYQIDRCLNHYFDSYYVSSQYEKHKKMFKNNVIFGRNRNGANSSDGGNNNVYIGHGNHEPGIA